MIGCSRLDYSFIKAEMRTPPPEQLLQAQIADHRVPLIITTTIDLTYPTLHSPYQSLPARQPPRPVVKVTISHLNHPSENRRAVNSDLPSRKGATDIRMMKSSEIVSHPNNTVTRTIQPLRILTARGSTVLLK